VLNKSERVLSILKEILIKPKVCVKSLALQYGTNKRTIQKDFELLNDYFQALFIKVDDCYFLLKKEQFHNLFNHNHKTSKQFLKFLSIVDSELYNQFKKENKELIKALKLDSSAIYQIENSPYEKLKAENLEILEQLEESIDDRKYISINYHSNIGNFHYSHSIPIKILYLNENWYLVVLTTNDIIRGSIYKQLRISSISSIKYPSIEPKTFDHDNIEKLRAENFLKKIQSAYSNMDKESFTVILKASANVAGYFEKKRYLTTQKIIKKLENGDIMLSFKICNEMEIIPIIQRWIPYLDVIEPLTIKEKVEKNLRKFMNLD
jgi:predicted DNA-binding transcriptional regulator YafY